MMKPSGKKSADFACVHTSQKGPAIAPLSIALLEQVFERLRALNSLVGGK